MNEVIVETDGCKENDRQVDSVFMCGVQARAKHDAVNTATAGCVTGGCMSARAGPQAACLGCVGFAAFSLLIEKIFDRHE
jgi:ribulose kinase